MFVTLSHHTPLSINENGFTVESKATEQTGRKRNVYSVSNVNANPNAFVEGIKISSMRKCSM